MTCGCNNPAKDLFKNKTTEPRIVSEHLNNSNKEVKNIEEPIEPLLNITHRKNNIIKETFKETPKEKLDEISNNKEFVWVYVLIILVVIL